MLLAAPDPLRSSVELVLARPVFTSEQPDLPPLVCEACGSFNARFRPDGDYCWDCRNSSYEEEMERK